MPTVTLENNEKIEMSNEQYAKIVDAIVEAARGHNGEQLIRDLEPGEYEICGKRMRVSFDHSGHKDYHPLDVDMNYAYINKDTGCWFALRDFEAYIGKPARLITPADIVRIMPKTGTALLDELEPGTLVAINGVRCAVAISSDCYKNIIPLHNSSRFISYQTDYETKGNPVVDWGYTFYFCQEIEKNIEDLVASDIVQLYPKGE